MHFKEIKYNNNKTKNYVNKNLVNVKEKKSRLNEIDKNPKDERVVQRTI